MDTNNPPPTPDIPPDPTLPILDLTIDYMISLKLFLETEYNIESESDSSIIRHLYNFLKNMKISNDDIKKAITLLYENINPEKINEMNYILNRLLSREYITTSLSDLFSSFTNRLNNSDTKEEHQEDNEEYEIQEDNEENKENEDNTNLFRTIEIDRYTQEFINPSNILNMFTTNLNNITPYNLSNFQVMYTSPSNFLTLDPFTYTFDMSFSQDPQSLSINNDPRITTHQNGKETLTKKSLNNNTIVDEFCILDEDEKKKYNTCSICFDDFNDNSIIRKIKCLHIFHKDCIDPWLLNQSYKCPICRDSVLPIKPPDI